MSDLLFKCPSCSKNLCVGASAAGKSFSCPTCSAQVIPPAIDFTFTCPKCYVELGAPEYMAMQDYNCPTCEHSFTIPAIFNSAQNQKVSHKCPSCSTEIPGGENICSNCMYDRRTGRKIGEPKERKEPVQIKEQSSPSPLSLSVPFCPSCRAEMPKDSVICMGCGFNTKTGEKVATKMEEKPKLSLKKDDPKSVVKYRCPECKAEMPKKAFVCSACTFDLRTGEKVLHEPRTNVPIFPVSMERNPLRITGVFYVAAELAKRCIPNAILPENFTDDDILLGGKQDGGVAYVQIKSCHPDRANAFILREADEKWPQAEDNHYVVFVWLGSPSKNESPIYWVARKRDVGKICEKQPSDGTADLVGTIGIDQMNPLWKNNWKLFEPYRLDTRANPLTML